MKNLELQTVVASYVSSLTLSRPYIGVADIEA